MAELQKPRKISNNKIIQKHLQMRNDKDVLKERFISPEERKNIIGNLDINVIV